VPQVKYNFKGIGELGDLQKDEMTGMPAEPRRMLSKLTNRCHWYRPRSHGVGISHFQGDTEASEHSQTIHA
jgi:hypothetical protein